MASILVVDDDEGVRSFLVDCLELDGHHVVEAVDGQDALTALARTGVQLVITDLRMPRMDGMALLRRLAEEQPEVEVILLTAHGEVGSAVEAMKLGAFDYLTKPIASPAELRLLVRRAVERHQARAAREATAHEGPTLTWGAPAMVPVVAALTRVAPTDATVLLLGESGTGKEVAARMLHARSRRASGPFVAVNCAALSASLLESELFGHERGAFTGATARRRGRIELADGGTFFLDEVGELAQELQAKLLRVLQEKTFERLGGAATLRADVRWVAATNRSLERMVADGRFREDLFHRLAVFPIQLPPLRERPEDLLPLARVLLARAAGDLGRPGLRLAPSAEAAILGAPWSGNARELGNALERAAILADGDVVEVEHLWLRQHGTPSPQRPSTMAQAEERAIRAALEACDGNRRATAEVLGIGLRTLYDKLKRYDLG